MLISGITGSGACAKVKESEEEYTPASLRRLMYDCLSGSVSRLCLR